ncbi:MAG: hypothetical protein J6I40_05295 [Mailhella sp.]|nr:hypothetical protein [Mailhella sp.]
MDYFTTIGLVLSKEGELALRARITSLPKDQAAVAYSYMKYPDQKKTHRKSGAKLMIWNAVRESPDFDLFFGRLIRSLPYDDYNNLIFLGGTLLNLPQQPHLSWEKQL